MGEFLKENNFDCELKEKFKEVFSNNNIIFNSNEKEKEFTEINNKFINDKLYIEEAEGHSKEEEKEKESKEIIEMNMLLSLIYEEQKSKQ
jgi:hypothetical protein